MEAPLGFLLVLTVNKQSLSFKLERQAWHHGPNCYYKSEADGERQNPGDIIKHINSAQPYQDFSVVCASRHIPFDFFFLQQSLVIDRFLITYFDNMQVSALCDLMIVNLPVAPNELCLLAFTTVTRTPFQTE